MSFLCQHHHFPLSVHCVVYPVQDIKVVNVSLHRHKVSDRQHKTNNVLVFSVLKLCFQRNISITVQYF